MAWKNISYPIEEGMAAYKNLPEKKTRIILTRTFEEGDMQETAVYLHLHTGTHVDYPRHAIEGGKTSNDYDVFPHTGRIFLMDVSRNGLESITLDDLTPLDLEGVDGLFIKTREKPLLTFDPEFPWLSAEGARYLSTLPLKYVGTDQPGIERKQPDHATHLALLGNDILVMEGLALWDLEEGYYDVLLTTLHVAGADAEPLLAYVAVE